MNSERDDFFDSGGQPPEPPGIYRIGADPGDRKRRGAKRAAPSPVSATGSALGSVPTVALSSAQSESSIARENMRRCESTAH